MRLVLGLAVFLLLLSCKKEVEVNPDDLLIRKAVGNYIADVEMPKKDSLSNSKHTIRIVDSVFLMEELKVNEEWLFQFPKIEDSDKPLFKKITSQVKESSLVIKPFELDSSFNFNYTIDSTSSSISKLKFSQVIYDSIGSHAVVVVKHKLDDAKSRLKGSFRSYLMVKKLDTWWVKNKRKGVHRYSRFHCAACALKK